jgi:hypothetical protein
MCLYQFICEWPPVIEQAMWARNVGLVATVTSQLSGHFSIDQQNRGRMLTIFNIQGSIIHIRIHALPYAG